MGVLNLRYSRTLWLFLTIPLLISKPEYVLGGGHMEMTSTAFKDGEKIPIQYVMPGAGGKNISVPLIWKNAFSGTKSFALSMVDPHPVAQNWVHWLVINIPANVTSLDEGASGKVRLLSASSIERTYSPIGWRPSRIPR